MMKKLITNNTSAIKFVGGLMIQPGDSRMVDVIPNARKKAFDPQSLVTLTVSELEARAAALTLDELHQVKAAEAGNEKPRQSAIKIIDREIDKREYDAELSEFASNLSAADNLDELLLAVAGDEAKIAMVEQEQQARAEKQKNDNK